MPLAQEGRFVFAVCQHGVESTLKHAVIGNSSPYRLAFSRPGLVTFKTNLEAGSDAVEEPPLAQLPQHWSIRQAGHVLGQLRGQDGQSMAGQAIELARARLPDTSWDAVHVFARDSALPGVKGFEPGPDALCAAVADQFTTRLPEVDCSGQATAPGARVLDVILVEPDHWLVGHHVADSAHTRWPGGALPLVEPPEMINRAYRKMAEAVAWSGLPIETGDRIVEIGSAPGGASQRLLDLGLRVTGVDPAAMDTRLLQHPRFEHWRSKSAAVKRRLYRKFRWLAADANVAPPYTLEVVEDIVNYPTSRIEGLILTLKLSSYDLSEQMDTYLQRVRGWGFEHVQVRQLASNRRECCVVAHRGDTWTPPQQPRTRQRRRQPATTAEGKAS